MFSRKFLSLLIILGLLVSCLFLNGCCGCSGIIQEAIKSFSSGNSNPTPVPLPPDNTDSNSPAIEPPVEVGWYDKGLALVKEEKYNEAIKCFDIVLETEPDNTDAWFEKGLCYYELKDSEKELKCYDEILKRNPDDADAWYNKGAVLSDTGRYEEAVKCFDKVLEMEPDAQDAKDAKQNALKALGQ